MITAYIRGEAPDGFSLLVERHTGMAYSVCYRILRETHAAEDAVQAAFLALSRRAAGVNWSHVSVSGWLYLAAVNSARELRRAAARRQKYEREAASMVQDQVQGGPERAWDDATAAEVDAALAQLPGRQREAVILRYIKGYSEVQAARELGCEPSVVNNRLRHAMESLRARFERRGVSVSAVALAGLALQHSQAPSGLVKNITAICGGKVAPTAAVSAVANATMKTMSGFKAVYAALLAALLLSAGAGAWLYPQGFNGAPPASPAPAKVPGREIDFRINYDDPPGRYLWGSIDRGPDPAEGRVCLEAVHVQDGPAEYMEVYLLGQSEALWNYRSGLRLRFELFARADVSQLTLHAGSLSKTTYSLPLPLPAVRERWTTVSVRLSDLQRYATGEAPPEHETFHNLVIAAPAGHFWIDNLVIEAEDTP